MNKIKVLYDVVKAMRNKEAFAGTLTVKVHQDEAQLFSLRNEFEKNLLTGQTKAIINTELDYDGKTATHESKTEFTLPRADECRHHGFFRHLHHSHAPGCQGLKGKLSRIAFVLSILNALQTEEQADKTILISLSAADLPEDTKALLREKMNRAAECHRHGPGCLKEFCTADNLDFAVSVSANKNHEVEKAVITVVGTRKDEQNTPHDLTVRAELSLIC